MKLNVAISDECVISSLYLFGMSMTKAFKRILLCTVLLANFVGVMCFASGKTMSCIDFFSVSKDDSNLAIKTNPVSVVDLLSNFCKVATGYKCEYDWYIFDASQSVFMSILCKNVWKTWYLPEAQMTWDKAVLKKYNFVSFDIYNYIDEKTKLKSSINYCDYTDTKTNMNNCDLSYFVPRIFDDLMNDFFNIRQASTMWISSLWDTFDKEEYAKIYVNTHFPWLSIQKWMEWGICQSKYYKKTCKYLKNYMWQLRNLLTTTEIINVKNLSTDKSAVNCDSDFDSYILYCGLLWSQNLPLYSLLRVVYNEYFWYDLFMSYYEYNLMSVEWDDASLFVEKAYKAKEQVYRSKQAITQALTSLSKVEYSLPIHVWFLMYQEDLNLFMWSLPKIFTPLKTLSDKLQNVQDADS